MKGPVFVLCKISSEIKGNLSTPVLKKVNKCELILVTLRIFTCNILILSGHLFLTVNLQNSYLAYLSQKRCQNGYLLRTPWFFKNFTSKFKYTENTHQTGGSKIGQKWKVLSRVLRSVCIFPKIDAKNVLKSIQVNRSNIDFCEWRLKKGIIKIITNN